MQKNLEVYAKMIWYEISSTNLIEGTGFDVSSYI